MTDIVVADASPIISAARAKKLPILESVYKSILIPPAVYNEIVLTGKGKPGEEIKKLDWIRIVEPADKNEIAKLSQKFGKGESEAIVLAVQEIKPLLIDDWVVISEARQRNVQITSTLLTLLKAKETKLISSVKQELDEYIKGGFRISDSLYQSVLEKAGE